MSSPSLNLSLPSNYKREADTDLVSTQANKRRKLEDTSPSDVMDTEENKPCPHLINFFTITGWVHEQVEAIAIAGRFFSLAKMDVSEWNTLELDKISMLFRETYQTIWNQGEAFYPYSAPLIRNALLAVIERMKWSSRFHSAEGNHLFDAIYQRAIKIFYDIESDQSHVEIENEFDSFPDAHQWMYFDSPSWENIFIQNYRMLRTEALRKKMETINEAIKLGWVFVNVARRPKLEIHSITEILFPSLRYILSQTDCPHTAPILKEAMLALSSRMSREEKYDTPVGRKLSASIAGYALGIFSEGFKPNSTDLPNDVWKLIFSHLLTQFQQKDYAMIRSDLASLFTVSKDWRNLALDVKNEWENQLKAKLKDERWLYKEDLNEMNINHFKIENDVACLELNGSLITGKQLAHIFSNARQLTKLSLNGYKNIPISEVIAWIKMLPKLTTLHLYPSQLIDEKSNKKFKLMNIINLSLTSRGNIKSQDIVWLANFFPNLEYLRLEDWDDLEGYDLVKALAKLPKLKKLELTGRCTRIMESDFEKAFKKHPLLTHFIFGELSHVDKNGLQFLSKLPKLKSLGLEDISMNADELISIGDMVPGLTELQFFNLVNTENFLEQLIKRLPNLIKLGLSNCHEIGHDDVMKALGMTSDVKIVEISECDKLTEPVCRLLEDKFPHITFIRKNLREKDQKTIEFSA